MEQWTELLVAAARTRLQKKRAAVVEDFAEASRLKKHEAALAVQVEEAKRAACAAGGGAATASERERLEKAKKRAVVEEDFAEASRLKKRLKLLDEQGVGEEALAKQAWAQALEVAAMESPGLLKELQAAAPVPTAGLEAAPCRAADAKPAGSPVAATLVKQELGCAGAVSSRPAPEQSPAPRGCSLEGVSVAEFIAMENQDIWQRAWEITWLKADAAGATGDQAVLTADAQVLWKSLLSEREELKKAEADLPRGAKVESPKTFGKQEPDLGSECLSEEQRAAQEQNWRENRGAAADWKRVQTEAERKKSANESGAGKSARDLCALVKQRSPADQPLQFERLLAVCPSKTTVRQLIQAMSKEPQEFRQNFDGSEFCVRPVNSRCTDWMPVQASTLPPGFRHDAFLPESMLSVARQIFEERLRPQSSAGEEPLAQFLAQPGRFPPDTPVPFADVLAQCPPGTKPMEVVRTMAKRRDLFRQDGAGTMFCIRPRAKCKDWGAVNPYADPTAQLAAPVGVEPGRPSGAGVVAGGPMKSCCEDDGEGEY